MESMDAVKFHNNSNNLYGLEKSSKTIRVLKIEIYSQMKCLV